MQLFTMLFTAFHNLRHTHTRKLQHMCLILLTSIGLLSACDVGANPKKASPNAVNTSAVEEKIKQQIQLKWDDVQVKSVRALPLGNLYEVVLSNNEIIYTNAQTDFTLIGVLIDNKDMRNLTQERTNELLTVDFKSLPLQQASTEVKGTGARHIAVFEDPNCGYCKRFRQVLEQTDDVTIHTFVIDILGPASTEMAQRLLCSPQPVNAWNAWMLNKTEPAKDTSCDTSVLEKNKALAKQLGITGTPTIIFANGQRIPGMASKETLDKALANQ